MSDTTAKIKKKKGPIRTEIALPFLLVVILTWAYFHFLFDHNLRKALEFVGYEVIGAEVDIRSLETSFMAGTIRLQGLEITNSQKPDRDMLVIEDIHFGVQWDGLLRARMVVDEMAVEQIQIDVPRKTPGRVKPPEPKKEQDSGALGKAMDSLKEKTLQQTQRQEQNNVLGDLAGLLAGGNSAGKIEGSLASKQKLAELQKFYDQKSQGWDQKLKALPQQKEIQDLGARIGKIKTSGFKSPQELLDSVNQIKAVLQDADQKSKTIQQTGQELGSDLNTLNQGLKDLDGLVKKDVADLEARSHIPKLDAQSLSEGVLRSYLDPYLARLGEGREIAEKLMPRHLPQKGTEKNPDLQIQPHPRAKGVTYEFGRQHSYPLFWIKKISISSKAEPQKDLGQMSGEVTDLSSNQALVGRPIVARLKGDFPSQGVQGFAFEGVLDDLKEPNQITFETSVAEYPIAGRPLIQSGDVDISFRKATASLTSKGQLTGFKDLQFSLQNSLKRIDYDIQAKNQMMQQILMDVFKSLPVLTLDAQGKGELPALNLAMNSNLGPELVKGFQKEIQKKIDEQKQKIQSYVNDQIGPQRSKLQGDYNKSKAQVDAQVQKLQAQVDGEKKQGDSKMNQAQKDTENKAKQQGQKALDDLKKQFGL